MGNSSERASENSSEEALVNSSERALGNSEARNSFEEALGNSSEEALGNPLSKLGKTVGNHQENHRKSIGKPKETIGKP